MRPSARTSAIPYDIPLYRFSAFGHERRTLLPLTSSAFSPFFCSNRFIFAPFGESTPIALIPESASLLPRARRLSFDSDLPYCEPKNREYRYRQCPCKHRDDIEPTIFVSISRGADHRFNDEVGRAPVSFARLAAVAGGVNRAAGHSGAIKRLRITRRRLYREIFLRRAAPACRLFSAAGDDSANNVLRFGQASARLFFYRLPFDPDNLAVRHGDLLTDRQNFPDHFHFTVINGDHLLIEKSYYQPRLFHADGFTFIFCCHRWHELNVGYCCSFREAIGVAIELFSFDHIVPRLRFDRGAGTVQRSRDTYHCCSSSLYWCRELSSRRQHMKTRHQHCANRYSLFVAHARARISRGSERTFLRKNFLVDDGFGRSNQGYVKRSCGLSTTESWSSSLPALRFSCYFCAGLNSMSADRKANDL